MKFTITKSLLASALLAVATASASLAVAGTLPTTLDVKQGAALQSRGALLLDVREVSEYAAGHAPGSTLIPLGLLQQRLAEIAGHKNQPVAVICRSGSRSAKAVKILEQAGFSAVANVEGGMNAWQKAGLPVVTGTASR
ncbi:MAG: rhodanese-like domain-containing protein [Burkholderiaceae bacterium]